MTIKSCVWQVVRLSPCLRQWQFFLKSKTSMPLRQLQFLVVEWCIWCDFHISLYATYSWISKGFLSFFLYTLFRKYKSLRWSFRLLLCFLHILSYFYILHVSIFFGYGSTGSKGTRLACSYPSLAFIPNCIFQTVHGWFEDSIFLVDTKSSWSRSRKSSHFECFWYVACVEPLPSSQCRVGELWATFCCSSCIVLSFFPCCEPFFF